MAAHVPAPHPSRPTEDAPFRAMIEHACIGVLSVDSEVRIDYANPHMVQMIGYAATELLGRPLSDLVFPSDRADLARLIDRRRQGIAEQFDFRLRRQDGSELWTQVSTHPSFDEHGRFCGATAMLADMTERRRMEAALQLSEERFKWVAYATSDALYEWDIPAGTIAWGIGIQGLTGFSEQDRLDFAWWTEHLHPEDRSRVSSGLSEAMQSGADFWTDEYRFCRQDGTYASVLDRGYFLRDEAGTAVRMIGAMEDQTERRQAEAERIQILAREESAKQELEAYRELDRLKTDFVNAVSHELRTPLASLMGFAEFLDDEIGGPLTPSQREFVQQLMRGSKRLEHLLNDLLDFARLDSNTFKLVYQEEDLGAKVTEVIRSLMPLARESNIELTCELPAESTLLSMDGHRIEQVLLNLVSNALKFTARGGQVRVRVRREPDDLRVEVQDTGPGIAPEDQAKLFQRFSQLPAGSQRGGTGLGLAISRALVEAHRGTIGVASTPGVGSTFWFRLPV